MAEKDAYSREAPDPFELPAYWKEDFARRAAQQPKKDDKNDDGGDTAPVKVLKRPADEDAITKKIEEDFGFRLAPPPPPPPPKPKEEEKSKGFSLGG